MMNIQPTPDREEIAALMMPLIRALATVDDLTLAKSLSKNITDILVAEALDILKEALLEINSKK